MPQKFIPFQPWRPDRSEFNTDGVEVVENVIRTTNGYRPFPGRALFNANAAALPAGRPTGLVGGKIDTDNPLAGDAKQFAFVNGQAPQKLEPDGSWTPVTGGTPWTVTTDERVRSAQWEDTLLITNYDNFLRGLDLQGTEQFELITYTGGQNPGANIKPRFLAVVRDFLVLGDLDDPTFDIGTTPRGGLHPDRIRWSGINQPYDFRDEGDPTTLSDFQDLPDAGRVQGIVGGEYGTVLCANGIFRMDFVGPPSVFAFNRIERARGCVAPNSIVTARNITYYLSDDGWKSFDGQQIRSIGAERFDRWWRLNADQSTYDSITSFVDPQNQLILVGFNSDRSSADLNDAVLVYNYELDEPSAVYFDHSIIGNFISPGYTIDTLEPLVTGTEGPPFIEGEGIDSLITPLDDPFYAAGSQQTGCLTATNGINSGVKLFTFTGVPDRAIIETSEQRLGGYQRARVRGIQSAIEGDGQDVRLRIGGRNRLGKDLVWGPWKGITAEGLYRYRGDARYQRVQAEITGRWRDATGVFVDYVLTSLR